MSPSNVHRVTLFRLLTGVKRSAVSLQLVVFVGIWLAGSEFARAIDPGAPILEERVESFSAEETRAAVERLINGFEEERGEPIERGGKGKVGLKVSTASGPGLSTPVSLVEAVIASLIKRGFREEEIFLIDQDERRLRRAGFLPPLGSEESGFGNHPVYVLESGDYYDPVWFYESPLPPRRGNIGIRYLHGEFLYEENVEGRKSYLPVPLLLDVDFWINLPVYTDHSVLGINGALLNATLWNASNTGRFFQSQTSGPAAVAEMAAIPELSEKWLFTIVSLELYQFAGGPDFRSLYTVSEPTILLSADPVALDSRMYQKINENRARENLPELENGEMLLDYAVQLGLGKKETESRLGAADR